MSHENFTPREAPNYTTAFLVSLLPIAFMTLWLIAGLFGFVWVILSATAVEIVYRARIGRS